MVMAPCLVSRVLQTPEMATEAAAGKPAKGRVSELFDMGVGHELSVTDHGTVALEPLLQRSEIVVISVPAILILSLVTPASSDSSSTSSAAESAASKSP